jgi:hypothetical protein
VLLQLKRVWGDGTSHLLFEALEFLEKLAAITPRPLINLILYHGVLTPHARWRSRIVPGPGVRTLDAGVSPDEARGVSADDTTQAAVPTLSTAVRACTSANVPAPRLQIRWTWLATPVKVVTESQGICGANAPVAGAVRARLVRPPLRGTDGGPYAATYPAPSRLTHRVAAP